MQILLHIKEVRVWKMFLTDKEFQMAKIKVTQIKSAINRPQRQKLTLQALGLGKLNRTVEHEATPQILGMVKKVEHMVKIVK